MIIISRASIGGGGEKIPCLLSSRWINVRFVIASTDVRVDDTR